MEDSKPTENTGQDPSAASGVADAMEDERLYDPPPGERQFSARAVLAGCLLGSAVVVMNLYLGLKIGWTEGGSLLAAIMGFALFAAIGRKLSQPYTRLENNITQTAGSGAGTIASAAGFLGPIPAMKMLGYEFSWWVLYMWALSVAYLGVMFAVPLRRQYVVIEKLRFPTGTATANTIVAMFARAGEAVAKARVLLYTGGAAFAFTVLAYFVPQLEAPPLHQWLGIGALATAAAWGFKLYLGPFLVGAGFLIGPRVGASLAAGAITGWALLGYIAQQAGWAPHENPMKIHDAALNMWGPRGWILWPGVAIMVADGFMTLALSWRTFARALRGAQDALAARSTGSDLADTEPIPTSWWATGLGVASLVTVAVSWLAFDISPAFSIIAIALSAVLANVAVRTTGETDINPVGPMGKVTQAAFGGLTTSLPPAAAMTTNLMSAAVTGAGASQSGDLMHDLKAGYLLGASPRHQFKAQLCGIFAGVLFAVPIYLLYDRAWDIGSEASPLDAPAAKAWHAVAKILSEGFDALPPAAKEAALIGLAFGAVIPVIRKIWPRAAPYTPSMLAFGLAFVIHPFYSLAMFAGSMVLLAWRNLDPEQCKRFVYPVACGLIAGEGIAGLFKALFTIFQVPTLQQMAG